MATSYGSSIGALACETPWPVGIRRAFPSAHSLFFLFLKHLTIIVAALVFAVTLYLHHYQHHHIEMEFTSENVFDSAAFDAALQAAFDWEAFTSLPSEESYMDFSPFQWSTGLENGGGIDPSLLSWDGPVTAAATATLLPPQDPVVGGMAMGLDPIDQWLAATEPFPEEFPMELPEEITASAVEFLLDPPPVYHHDSVVDFTAWQQPEVATEEDTEIDPCILLSNLITAANNNPAAIPSPSPTTPPMTSGSTGPTVSPPSMTTSSAAKRRRLDAGNAAPIAINMSRTTTTTSGTGRSSSIAATISVVTAPEQQLAALPTSGCFSAFAEVETPLHAPSARRVVHQRGVYVQGQNLGRNGFNAKKAAERKEIREREKRERAEKASLGKRKRDDRTEE